MVQRSDNVMRVQKRGFLHGQLGQGKPPGGRGSWAEIVRMFFIVILFFDYRDT